MIAAVVAIFASAIFGSRADSVMSLLTNSSTLLANRTMMMDDIPLIRLTRDLLAKDKYDVRVRPIIDHTKTLKVHISISLYQIIEVDEPSQNIKLNVWMIQKWKDEYLSWDPRDYGMINSTIIPFKYLWIPDTYLYNSVKMSRDETERYMNIQVESLHWKGENGSQLSFLYPAIYTITCRLNIRFFPYDRQNCTLTISSWTNSKSALDYYADAEVNLASYIPNEEWDVKSFKIFRHEYKYACCAEPWVILQASLVIQRKPLYYIVNLIIPTSIITIVSITGFFTPASTDDDRTEKINLGITTLLAMSILMLMVSDQMPTTSEFVPLIAWFYLSIIIIVSIGTFLTSVVLSVQSRRQYGRNPPPYIRYYFFVVIPSFIYVSVPPALEKLWSELDDDPLNAWRRRKMSTWEREKTGSLYKERPPKSPMLERQSTLRVPKHGLDRFNSIQMIDVSVPPSPAASRLSRTPSMVQPQRPTLWEGTMSALADRRTGRVHQISAQFYKTYGLFEGTNTQLRRTSAAFSREVEGMRRKRQCSLEWEFLATVLDR
ncbi:Neurotransmitter-gated ion-channel ligand binding domain protein [Ancylostoma ceylanicum]|uniref:Neurotransmitter-gated ion-channel ligand binding domain protein n=1 Tax=Ancylostoma ceylanicum TaxID=53326 RepID=A0A0D6M4R4_9BILA|nr:Neurotransmitter-gated ion-channel ligand binding domain protein [Ancylostoma ceylanicum]